MPILDSADQNSPQTLFVFEIGPHTNGSPDVVVPGTLDIVPQKDNKNAHNTMFASFYLILVLSSAPSVDTGLGLVRGCRC